MLSEENSLLNLVMSRSGSCRWPQLAVQATAAVVGAVAMVSSTSSNVSGHSHTVCVPTSNLTSPPASGATYQAIVPIRPTR